MNIGDLFFTFRGDGANLQVDAKTQGAKAGTSLASSVAASFKKSFTGANIGKGLVQGLGLAGGLGIASVVSKATDLVGASIDAFRQDQVSVQALGTALRDNVKDWDGNTDAIERTIKARTALGFSDDDQRASLATIATSTHDVTKALELEQGAMDIARAKGIDLATASDAVAKAYGGNTKSLKSLIPGLNLGHSSAEALANAFKAVGGAASDFAKTDLGKVQVEEAKTNEAMEKLGSVLSGPVADGASAAADALTSVLDALDTLQGQSDQAKGIDDSIANLISTHNLDGLKQAQASLQDATDKFKHPELVFAPATFNQLMEQLDQVNGGLDTVNKSLDHFQGTATTVGDHSTDAIEKMRGSIVGDLGDMADASDDWRKAFSKDSGQVIRDSDKVRSQLAKDAQGLIDDYFNPIEEASALTETHFTTLADVAKVTSAKTATDLRLASEQVVSDLDDQATSLTALGDQGDLTKGQVDRFTSDVTASYRAMGIKVPDSLQKIIDTLHTLAGIPDDKFTFTLEQKGNLSPAGLDKIAKDLGFIGNEDLVKKNPFRAAGGSVEANSPYIVGERGAEMFVPKTAGVIVPHAATMALAAAGGSGGDTNINVSLLDRMEAHSVRDIGDGLRMLERRGYLGRRR